MPGMPRHLAPDCTKGQGSVLTLHAGQASPFDESEDRRRDLSRIFRRNLRQILADRLMPGGGSRIQRQGHSMGISADGTHHLQRELAQAPRAQKKRLGVCDMPAIVGRASQVRANDPREEAGRPRLGPVDNAIGVDTTAHFKARTRPSGGLLDWHRLSRVSADPSQI